MPEFVKWNYPTSITVGAGCLETLGEECKSAGITNALIVTDSGLTSLPMVDAVIRLCNQNHVSCQIFSQFATNPTGEDVSLGVKQYHLGKFDGVVALGGGSSIDVAKSIAFMSGQSESLWSFEDEGENWKKAKLSGIAPIIAIPTTAGTGSEVGRAAVITDHTQQIKKVIFHPKMLPKKVLLDPELTLGLPPHITAATGMDALSHSLEAFCSPNYHPMADGIAIQAMPLVQTNLPVAFQHGSNIEARSEMLVASSMGATAFQKGLGAMHAIAHPLGALYNKHHGLLNAIVMPYVLKANRNALEEKMEALACYMNLDEYSFDGVLNWVLDLRSSLSIPNTLAEIDIDTQQASLVGSMAEKDPSASGNPIQFNAEQYCEIFVKAVKGEL